MHDTIMQIGQRGVGVLRDEQQKTSKRVSLRDTAELDGAIKRLNQHKVMLLLS